ncbi:MAG TPA: FeoA family protein [Candidatus Dormibacteraeota bacterium]|nr:FeoA family protein [Candidatus Dormibacteraeota bacterium]
MPPPWVRVPAATARREAALTLDTLHRGGRGAVLEVRASGDQLARDGIAVGMAIRVLDRAPFGGPVIVEAAGARLAIARDLARAILVGPIETVSGSDAAPAGTNPDGASRGPA